MAEERAFRAVLERDATGLGWTIARLPFAPAEAWPAMVRLRVGGRLRGPGGEMAFRTSLFPLPGGTGYFLLVTRAMQATSGLATGAVGEFWVEPDLEPRPAELPEALDCLLDEEEGLRTFYEGLSEYMRREIGKWCVGVRGEDARLRRAEQMAERLLATMEAETELSPAIEAAFRARPRARQGWGRMTATQRRGELFAVFHYRTPEARAGRIAKLCDGAEARLE